MFASTREPLNPFWCQYHWRPYLIAPTCAQARINAYVPQHLWSLEDFKDQVCEKLRKFGHISNAPQLVVIDWTRASNRSMCCILGDEVMDRMRARIRRELDLPL